VYTHRAEAAGHDQEPQHDNTWEVARQLLGLQLVTIGRECTETWKHVRRWKRCMKHKPSQIRGVQGYRL